MCCRVMLFAGVSIPIHETIDQRGQKCKHDLRKSLGCPNRWILGMVDAMDSSERAATAPASFAQWMSVAHREGRGLGWLGKLDLALRLVRYAFKRRQVTPGERVRRLLICAKCPIYDAHCRRCRPYDGSNVGCGCYVPYLVTVRKPYERPGCWWNNVFQGALGGWGEAQNGTSSSSPPGTDGAAAPLSSG